MKHQNYFRALGPTLTHCHLCSVGDYEISVALTFATSTWPQAHSSCRMLRGIAYEGQRIALIWLLLIFPAWTQGSDAFPCVMHRFEVTCMVSYAPCQRGMEDKYDLRQMLLLSMQEPSFWNRAIIFFTMMLSGGPGSLMRVLRQVMQSTVLQQAPVANSGCKGVTVPPYSQRRARA